ncbi:MULTISPECIES: hypothetical protein [unclassified Yoonia]|uniref:hypothetical protein n=1 Tax=unclassified Yoonia TaxID=2629118 RepID=UPI002AFEB7ED|nr:MULTISPECIES: hypothetical protein [unclassified Yoonia]
MNGPVRDTGSFRDPSGYVFTEGDRVLRAVMPAGAACFLAAHDTGVLHALEAKGLLISSKKIDADDAMLARCTGARGDAAVALFEHPRIPFLTYPYEWCFAQLKDAAIAHLNLQLLALEHGYELSDATAYNMQFVDGRPIHIDPMSVRPYVEGAHWAGYNQFCRQFLLPLLIEAWAGLSFQALYRGSINGISFDDALAILPRRKLFSSVSGFMHVYLHGRAVAARSSASKLDKAPVKKLPKTQYVAILAQLKDFVGTLETRKRLASYWKTYAEINSYSDQMRERKLAFVQDWASQEKPSLIWDIGGNTGDFSLAAIKGGASAAVILDGDIDSIERAYRLRAKKGAPLLPVLMNISDPTPNLGWRQSERKGLNERAPADGLIALAIIHHMCIGTNLPLAEAIRWLLQLAPVGIVEFVPKDDPMVRQLLAVREDVFDDYREDVFLATIAETHEITKQHRFAENNRLLVSYRRRQ